MQGPQGPGSPRVDRRRGRGSRATGAALRREDGRERTVVGNADAQPLVSVPVRADPIVQYPIKCTVNGHDKTERLLRLNDPNL
jgi:hypothetical protein